MVKYKNMKLLGITLSTLLLICQHSSAQNTFINRKELTKKNSTLIEIQPRIGISWQSTLFKPLFDFSYIPELSRMAYPIKYEKGTQGFGGDFGANFLLSIGTNNSIGLRPNIRYRYDYFYGVEIWEPYNKIVKASIFDISTYFLFSHKMQNSREWLIYFGYTFNQVGKKKFFDLSNTANADIVPGYPYVTVNFQYPSLNYGFEYDFIKLNKALFLSGSFLLNYIPHGDPAYPWRDFMTMGFGISVKYKPQSLTFSF